MDFYHITVIQISAATPAYDPWIMDDELPSYSDLQKSQKPEADTIFGRGGTTLEDGQQQQQRPTIHAAYGETPLFR